jgi:hypothetical protein
MAKNECQRPTFLIVVSVRLCLPFLPYLPYNCVLSPYANLITGLFAVTIRQALFIAPCSHAFHYKCIRPLLEAHTSAFSCPLCRTFADLDEDVEVEAEPEPEADIEAISSPEEDDDEDEGRGGENNLAPPMVRDGAETEVEGDARGTRARIRTAGHVAHPQPQSQPQSQSHPYPTAQSHPPHDDAGLDEEMLELIDIDVDSDEGDVDGGVGVFVRGGNGSGSGNGSAEGMGLESGMGGVAMVVDGDGIISGKRKR